MLGGGVAALEVPLFALKTAHDSATKSTKNNILVISNIYA